MWTQIERWSWVASILGALLAFAAYTWSKRSGAQAEKNRKAAESLQVELLEEVKKLRKSESEALFDAQSNLNSTPQGQTLSSQHDLPNDENLAQSLKKVEDLQVSLNSVKSNTARSEIKARKTGNLSLGVSAAILLLFGIFATVNHALMTTVMVGFADRILDLVSKINLSLTISWIISYALMGALVALISFPVVKQLHSQIEKWSSDRTETVGTGSILFFGIALTIFAIAFLVSNPLSGDAAVAYFMQWPFESYNAAHKMNLFGADLFPVGDHEERNFGSSILVTLPLGMAVCVLRAKLRGWLKFISGNENWLISGKIVTVWMYIVVIAAVARPNVILLIFIAAYYVVINRLVRTEAKKYMA
ncbi:Mic19 family protein [Actinokineospora spheciospongiae]|uniref:hypothetical protein n=1 Tax=Actinokineospora spheciospongiae TaxID=909613 RepID=UPI0011B3D2C5|nr:hypothetical protein [Actinokineospora spheciospongiae]